MKSAVAISLVGLAAVAACGDNRHEGHPVDAAVDSVIDVPPDAFVECNYTEGHDLTNDYLAVAHAFEETDIKFATGGTRTVCGTVNNGHYDSANGSIDIDNYGITVTEATDVLVRLTGSGTAISSLGVFIGDDNDVGLVGSYYVGNHAVFSTHLAAGHYHFSVEAYDDHDAAASVPYEMRITTDVPDNRCKHVATAADYTEAHDGVLSDSNDVVAIDYNNFPTRELTGSLTDVPEPTNLVLGTTRNYVVEGISASTAVHGSYFDRDTYLFTSGADANEMTVRLNWPGASDLDFYVFQEGIVSTSLARAETRHAGEGEFATFAVKPMSRYWLWVGADNTSSGLPVVYDATICPSKFQ